MHCPRGRPLAVGLPALVRRVRTAAATGARLQCGVVAAVVVRRRWSDGGARLDLNLFVVEVLVRGDTGQVEGRDGRQEQPHSEEDQTHRL